MGVVGVAGSLIVGSLLVGLGVLVCGYEFVCASFRGDRRGADYWLDRAAQGGAISFVMCLLAGMIGVA